MKGVRIVILMLMLMLSGVVFGQTHIYERYATHSNLEVAYLKGFSVSETQRINVTILRAKNDRAWRWLKKEFKLQDMAKDVKNAVTQDEDIVIMDLRDKENPSYPQKSNLLDNCILTACYNTQTIILYHYATDEEFQSIIGYSIKKLI